MSTDWNAITDEIKKEAETLKADAAIQYTDEQLIENMLFTLKVLKQADKIGNAELCHNAAVTIAAWASVYIARGI